MNRTKIRIAAAAAALALTAVIAVPGFSATTPGSLSIRVPDSFSRDNVPISWTYKTGTVVTSNSFVDVLASSNASTWSPIAVRIPIRNATYTWNISGWDDAIYAVRLRVSGTSAYSATDYAYVDHSNPEVEITKPSRNEVTVDDSALAAADAVVAGRTTLKASASDALSGIANVIWELDGNAIASGASAVYDFTASPGRHELTAVAYDAAGNSSSASITVVALPGSSAGTLPDEVPEVDPNAVPSPDPSTLPTPDPTTLPTLPGIPSPDPSAVPSPDPTSIPIPSPSPSVPPLP